MAPEKTGRDECPSSSETSSKISSDNNTQSDEAVALNANTSGVSVDSCNGEHDPYFEPVVSLPEVAIRSLEEDEEEIYKGRCKLFRHVRESDGSPQWKERGTGDVKLLKNAEKSTIRLLMRQEKTLKVRANHYITPYMRLRPNCSSDRAFVWCTMVDFADEQSKNETFAIRFATVENAQRFKAAFEDAVSYITESLVDCLAVIPDHESEDEEEKPLKASAVEEEEKVISVADTLKKLALEAKKEES